MTLSLALLPSTSTSTLSLTQPTMSSSFPRTPTRATVSSFPLSHPSPTYWNYISQPYSSPTPFPSSDTPIPTEISPYLYQLAHLPHHTPLATLRPPSTAFLTGFTCASDASDAFKPAGRSFSTLTAAETLLSVHQLSSPRPYLSAGSRHAGGSPSGVGPSGGRLAAQRSFTPSSSSASQLTNTDWQEFTTPSRLSQRSSSHGRVSKGALAPYSQSVYLTLPRLLREQVYCYHLPHLSLARFLRLCTIIMTTHLNHRARPTGKDHHSRLPPSTFLAPQILETRTLRYSYVLLKETKRRSSKMFHLCYGRGEIPSVLLRMIVLVLKAPTLTTKVDYMRRKVAQAPSWLDPHLHKNRTSMDRLKTSFLSSRSPSART